MDRNEFNHFCRLIRMVWHRCLPELDISKPIENLTQLSRDLASDIQDKAVDSLSKNQPPIDAKTLSNYTKAVVSETLPKHQPYPRTLEILSIYALSENKLAGENLRRWDENKEYNQKKYWNRFTSLFEDVITYHHNSSSQIESSSLQKSKSPISYVLYSLVGFLLLIFISAQFCFLHKRLDSANLSKPLYLAQALKIGDNCISEKQRAPELILEELLKGLDGVPAIINNPNYPCYKYQGIWQLDTTSDYSFPASTADNTIYYRSFKATLYAWCVDDGQGDLLMGLQVLTAEVLSCDEKGCPEYEAKVIGEIPSLFLDQITLKDPLQRQGYKIGRYRPIPNSPSANMDELEEALKFIDHLNVTNCDSMAIDTTIQGNLRMNFYCYYAYTSDNPLPYTKKLIHVKNNW